MVHNFFMEKWIDIWKKKAHYTSQRELGFTLSKCEVTTTWWYMDYRSRDHDIPTYYIIKIQVVTLKNEHIFLLIPDRFSSVLRKQLELSSFL